MMGKVMSNSFVPPAPTEGAVEAPRRVQLSRAKGWKMPPNTVKVDRSTKWGNPYRTGTCLIGNAEMAVMAFAANLPLGNFAEELRGKNLACWCKIGDWCHADVLLEVANAPNGTLAASSGTEEPNITQILPSQESP